MATKTIPQKLQTKKTSHHQILPIPKRAVLFPLKVAFYGLCHFLFRTEVTHMLLPHRPLILLPVASIRRIFWDPNNTPHSRFSKGKLINRWRRLTWCHERCKVESMRCILYVPVCLSTHIVTVTQKITQQAYNHNNMHGAKPGIIPHQKNK